ncbi:MAG: SulP family inorganic anion transporter, partial [Cytophagaceae bacterium]|nr:SulP family inorganic anion transporter [Cytophagaceae bacterium]
HAYKIGWEQLIIFCITIVFTLGVDLLVGIGAGMLTEMLINLINGKPIRATFKAPVWVYTLQGDFVVEVSSAAVFSNWLSIKKELDAVPAGSNVTIDLSQTRLVDHSVMENLHLFEKAYNQTGGFAHVTGLDKHKPVAGHALSARKLKMN